MMNQLWVRISLTIVAIVVFLIWLPSGIYLAFQADNIELAENVTTVHDGPQFLQDIPKAELILRLLRMLLSIAILASLVGIISSRGLAAPLHNLAVAARAVGSQDLSQRIEVRGSSEIREVAEAFNAMAEALERAEELRNNMLADIAHELRTPLTVIQGNLRAILDDVYDLDKVEVARLYDQTRQLSRLVDDLHDLALLEANQFSLTISTQDLVKIVQEVAAIYQPLVEDQGLSLVLNLPNGSLAVEGDAARITQCLNNLLNNALRYTPAGGEIQLGVAGNEQALHVTVTDTGEGIEPEHLPHIFDRFYRADPDRSRQTGGTGLGLAITQALVKAHGGEIRAYSPGKGQGSTFSISLPQQSLSGS